MKKVVALIALGMLTGSSVADTVRTVWRVSGLTQYDYASGQYVTPTVPTTFDVTVDFPATVSDSVDYGRESITYLGGPYETTIASPLTQYVGADPFGDGLTNVPSYAFANSDDYESTFLEGFVAQSSAYSQSPSDQKHWTYITEIRAWRLSPSRGGAGSADYVFTMPGVLEFLSDVKESPESYTIVFGELWDIFDGAAMTYLDGAIWSSHSVQLLSFEVIRDNDPPRMFEDLLAKLAGVGPGSSLADKINLSQTYYAVSDLTSACLMLTDFERQVTAQTSKKIDAILATELIEDASELMTTIGCE